MAKNNVYNNINENSMDSIPKNYSDEFETKINDILKNSKNQTAHNKR